MLWKEVVDAQGDLKFYCDGREGLIGGHMWMLKGESRAMRERPVNKEFLLPRFIGPVAVKLVLEFIYFGR